MNSWWENVFSAMYNVDNVYLLTYEVILQDNYENNFAMHYLLLLIFC
jgi:hypothetical protein